MRAVTAGSLFSGIGGLDLTVEAVTGARTLWQVECDPWCRSVLARHWPQARRYDDVRTAGKELERVDIIAGGFPCQDLSHAGKRAGLAGERSGLWREFARIIRVVGPRFVFVENVSGLLSDSGAMGAVLGDLAAMGFSAEWGVFRASDVGAPHRRERVFVLAVADAGSERSQGLIGAGAASGAVGRGDGEHPGVDAVSVLRGVPVHDSPGARTRMRMPADRRMDGGPVQQDGDASQPRLGRSPDGLPRGLDSHRWPAGRDEAQHEWEAPRVAQGIPERRQRLKALGNAVVPQQAALALTVLAERLGVASVMGAA